MGKILLFNVKKNKRKMIEKAAWPIKAEVKDISKREYTKTLGSLAGLAGMSKPVKPYDGAEFPNEMMVFSGIDTDQLDVFLAKYKELGIDPIERKAVITQTNVFWTALKLYEEIDEHAV